MKAADSGRPAEQTTPSGPTSSGSTQPPHQLETDYTQEQPQLTSRATDTTSPLPGSASLNNFTGDHAILGSDTNTVVVIAALIVAIIAATITIVVVCKHRCSKKRAHILPIGHEAAIVADDPPLARVGKFALPFHPSVYSHVPLSYVPCPACVHVQPRG